MKKEKKTTTCTLQEVRIMVVAALAVFVLVCRMNAANPYLPLWEFIPDGEPYVFDDPDKPGEKRVYIYGSHDNRRKDYCGRDQVVWSASVNDLNNWRYDGVIFRSLLNAEEKPLNKDGSGDILFAPDVAVKAESDGTRTYYLYPNTQASGRNGMVAKAKRPDGPFEVCNWDESNPNKTRGPLAFDPAVFVDDDGRVYGYWGFRQSFAAELDPSTMATVKPGTAIVTNMISSLEQPGIFRFFEASSIRKINDKYVFIYSRWTKKGEFGLGGTNYTLAYAYSDKPLGPWTYGGTIIDARGRETKADGHTVVTATLTGNTHGSICEINGKWWIFYHRQCGTDEFSRQAMVAPITIEVEPGPGGKVKISEGEYTSEGFEIEGLDPFARQVAGIACYYTGGPYMKPCYIEGIGEKAPYAEKINRCPVVHIVDGSVVGYKYFDFRKTHGKDGLELELDLVPQGVDADVEIWAVRPNALEGGVKIGSFSIKADFPEKLRTVSVDVSQLAARNSKEALFFVFKSKLKEQSICELESLRFALERGDKPLKDYVPYKFGVAVRNQVYTGGAKEEEKIVLENFNMVTPENDMKSGAVQPREGEFDFSRADQFVDWAEKNGLDAIGHVLIWHEQRPPWFDKDSNGAPCSKEVLLERMEKHIKTVVGRYKGRIKHWDVANEAIENDGSYRKTPFYEIIGEEFIDYAFKFAHEADPDCELWYTDYGNEFKKKNKAIAALVRRLKEKGIRIDGVGMQTHVQLKYPDVETYEDGIKLIAAEGVKLAITEFDIGVLPNAWKLSPEELEEAASKKKYNPWPNGLPADVERRLAERYAEWFAMFRRNADVIDRVTIWGVSDKDSWLNNAPVWGRSDYPLFFDRELHMKSWVRSSIRK